jgi:hypothetical protein
MLGQGYRGNSRFAMAVLRRLPILSMPQNDTVQAAAEADIDALQNNRR